MTYSGKGRPPVLFVNGLKPCSRCKVQKPPEAFDKMRSAASGYQSVCKECRATGILVANQTPGRRSRRDSVLYNKYGIREEEYLELYVEQMGRCAICGIFQDVLCLDHNHKTKKNRGLLCKECNFGLGKFDDDLEKILAAAAYLLKWKEQE